MEEETGARRQIAVQRETPYRQWQRSEGIPIVRGSYVEDPLAVEVADWPRLGQKGAFVNLANQEMDDAWIIEIAPGGETEPLHHMFEAGVIVLDGRGATSFWQPGREQKKQTVEWQRGSLFAPPLNCCYQHFNLDGQKPARLLAVTIAPMVINLFRNPDFVFNDTALFTDRYNGEDDYWVDHGERESGGEFHHWRTNFVPDLRTFRMGEYRDRSFRGYDNRSMSFRLSNNSMASSNALFGVGTYKKGHRHGPGAHLLILRGMGYSLLWRAGQDRKRVSWREGTLVSPQDGEFHQHFNTGPEPAMYFKFRLDQLRITPSAEGFGRENEPEQIEYEDEDPEIYELFQAECVKNGVTDLMPTPKYSK